MRPEPSNGTHVVTFSLVNNVSAVPRGLLNPARCEQFPGGNPGPCAAIDDCATPPPKPSRCGTECWSELLRPEKVLVWARVGVWGGG
jgi:hypothetical protein